jgi:endoribonuclease Dicer
LNKIEIEKRFSNQESNESQNSIFKSRKKNIQSCDHKQPFTSLRNTDWSFPYFMDDDTRVNFTNQSGPGPALLLQALTLSNAADGFDLERLETVGDSFLKQAITVYLFFAYPDVHEGKLSYLRSKQVSNYNLYKLGKRRGIHELIVSTKFEPLDSWLPSHYESIASINNSNMCKTQKTAPNSASILLNSLLSKPVSKNLLTEASNAAHTITFDKYKEHLVSDKSIADSVEAIIGAYLITSGPQAALQIMSWFGLEVLPKARSEDGAEVLVNIPQVPAPKINDPLKLEELIDGYAPFEACIGYKFKQPAYLLQAFTHSSYTYNTVTDCYQRLEFLGNNLDIYSQIIYPIYPTSI